jgi:uncharacterized protein (TIGR03067 family)
MCFEFTRGGFPVTLANERIGWGCGLLLVAASTVAFASGASEQAQDPPAVTAKSELEKMQGTWALTYREFMGKEDRPVPEGPYKLQMIIKGDAMTIKAGGPTYSGIVLKVDPTKTPKTFDSRSYDRATKTKIRHLGIYEWNGEDLKTCVSISGRRPTEYKSDDSTAVNVYKRQKP